MSIKPNFFPGFTFGTAQVAYLTAVIYHVFEQSRVTILLLTTLARSLPYYFENIGLRSFLNMQTDLAGRILCYATQSLRLVIKIYVCLLRLSRHKVLLTSKLIVVSVSQEAEERRTFAVNYMKEISHTAILTERKKKKLNEILPGIFCKMVHSAVTDLNDLDAFMKNSFERIKNK